MRSLLPWMARAISSLPTPDSPSIRIGICDAAARLPRPITRSIAGLLVTMSAKVSVPAALRFRRAISPSSAPSLRAFSIDTWSRSIETGLTTKSTAPARIALTTVSMPPWAVWTITGSARSASRSRASTAMPSSSGITRSRMTRETASPAGRGEVVERLPAARRHDGAIAEPLHGMGEQPALDGVVVDDEERRGHLPGHDRGGGLMGGCRPASIGTAGGATVHAPATNPL